MTKIFLCLALFFSLPGVSQSVLGDPRAIIYALDVYSENQQLLALADKHRVELWNYDNGKCLKTWNFEPSPVSVALAGNSVVVAQANGYIDVFSALTFEKTMSVKLTDDIALAHVKAISDGMFIVSDVQGNVYKTDSVANQLMIKKLFTAPTIIRQISFVNNQDMLVTFHDNGKILLWSMDGTIVKEKDYAGKYLASNVNVTMTKIYISSKSGRIDVCSANPSDFMRPIRFYRTSAWPVALDHDVAQDVVVVGSTTGDVEILTSMGRYKERLNAIVNVVRVLTDEAPQLKAAVGTHGGGIQILLAADMKLK